MKIRSHSVGPLYKKLNFHLGTQCCMQWVQVGGQSFALSLVLSFATNVGAHRESRPNHVFKVGLLMTKTGFHVVQRCLRSNPPKWGGTHT